MTETRYTERNENGKQTFRLYSCGHSGLIEDGVDVGCRASSAICCSLVNAVDSFDGEKKITVKDGSCEIEITVDEERADVGVLFGCFLTARYGLSALAKKYPENFRYVEKLS